MTANPKPSTDNPAEKLLCDIALACDVSVGREEGQSLATFAEEVKAAIAEKLLELNDYIDEIDALDLDDDVDEEGH